VEAREQVFMVSPFVGKGTLYWYCVVVAAMVFLVRVYLLVLVCTCQNHSI
jgi:hypothetical protein